MAKKNLGAKTKPKKASPPNPLKLEFLQLFKASGWTQAEVARQLELTRGGVNGIITGRTVPSHATLKLFKLILLAEKPEAIRAARPASVQQAEESWLRELLEQVRRVAPAHRERLISALKTVAGAFPKNPRSFVRNPTKDH
jgi:transcriptional regulator with XRE-family HTH domain